MKNLTKMEQVVNTLKAWGFDILSEHDDLVTVTHKHYVELDVFVEAFADIVEVSDPNLEVAWRVTFAQFLVSPSRMDSVVHDENLVDY